MASNAVVERAAWSDIPALLDLMFEFYAESSYALDRGWAEESFRQLLQDDSRGAVWIARQGSDVAGYVVLTLRHSMEFGGLTGVIDDFFVRAGFRRRGIGSALIAALFETCRSLRVLAVHVEVGSNNVAAGSVYRSFGLGLNGDDRQFLTALLS